MKLPDNTPEISQEEMKSLFERSRKGDTDAFRTLSERLEAIIAGTLWTHKFPKQDFDQIIQNTLSSVWYNLAQVQSFKTFYSWVRRIAVNEGFDLHKKEKRVMAVSGKTNKTSSLLQHADPAFRNQAKADFVKEAISNLPDDEREVVVYYYYSKNTYKEISDITGVPVTTVKTRLESAYEKLALHLKDLIIGGLALNITFNSQVSKAVEMINSGHIPPHPDELTAAAAATTTSTIFGTIYSWVTSVMWFSFMMVVWLFSIVSGAFLLGVSLVKNAPTLQLRRWHVRNNFILYGFGVIGVLLMLCVLPLFPNQLFPRVAYVYCVLFVSVVGLYLMKAIKMYKEIIKIDTLDSVTISYQSLAQLINRGSFWASFILLVGMVCMIIETLIWEYASFNYLLCTVVFEIIVLAYHGFACYQFQRFLKLSGDDVVFASQGENASRRQSEYYFFALCILFAIGPNLVHLINQPLMSFNAMCEILLCSCLWYVVFLLNKKDDVSNYLRIGGMLFAQEIIMHITRQFIY